MFFTVLIVALEPGWAGSQAGPASRDRIQKRSSDTMSQRELDNASTNANPTRTLISAGLFGSPNCMGAKNELSPLSQDDAFESGGVMHSSPFLSDGTFAYFAPPTAFAMDVSFENL